MFPSVRDALMSLGEQLANVAFSWIMAITIMAGATLGFLAGLQVITLDVLAVIAGEIIILKLLLTAWTDGVKAIKEGEGQQEGQSDENLASR